MLFKNKMLFKDKNASFEFSLLNETIYLIIGGYMSYK